MICEFVQDQYFRVGFEGEEREAQPGFLPSRQRSVDLVYHGRGDSELVQVSSVAVFGFAWAELHKCGDRSEVQVQLILVVLPEDRADRILVSVYVAERRLKETG